MIFCGVIPKYVNSVVEVVTPEIMMLYLTYRLSWVNEFDIK